MTADAPVVAVFRKDLLPPSETFIAAQVGAYSRYEPALVGYQQVDGIGTDQFSPAILYDASRGTERLRLKRDQYLAIAGRPIRRLAHTLDRLRPSLVHAHFGYDAVLIADTVAHLGLPLVVTLHGTDILRDWRSWSARGEHFFFRFYPAAFRRMTARSSVHFLAVSDALRQVAIRQGVPADRIEVAYTGIDVSRPQPGRECCRQHRSVLFVGRLVEFKGCEVLIRAMEVVRRRWPDASLTVAGDGPLRPHLERLATDLGVTARFLGRIDSEEVAMLMCEASIFCLPSITDRDGAFEAFGMVMLEAQTTGVPVVTSSKAGPEIIDHGRTGLLFDERDVSALADLLDDLFRHPEKGASIARAAREHVSTHFDLLHCMSRIEGIYDEVVRRR